MNAVSFGLTIGRKFTQRTTAFEAKVEIKKLKSAYILSLKILSGTTVNSIHVCFKHRLCCILTDLNCVVGPI